MNEQVVCDVCGILVDRNKYERHIKFGHKEKIKKDFVCHLCQKSFTSLYNLQYHMAHHINARNFLCNECPRAYNTAADLTQHQRIHEKQRDPYKCDECGLIFQIKSRYNTHMRIHKTESKEPKECPICKKSFICLSSHNRIVHMNLRNYNCNLCEKKFGKKSGLDRHILTVHEKQKNFVCQHCSKAFGEKAQLKKHIRVHSLVRDVTYCTKCKKNFDNIKEHYDEVHGNLKHICQSCFKRFEKLRDLEIHIKTKHSTFRSYFCDFCCKGFAEKFQLERHLKLHQKNINFDENIKTEKIKCDKMEQIFIDEQDPGMKIEEDAKEFTNFMDIKGKHETIDDNGSNSVKIEDSSITKVIHSCKKCRKVFDSSNNLKLHFQNEHAINKLSNEKQKKARNHNGHLPKDEVTCIGCSATYNSKSEMQQHFNEIHDTVTGYHCTICNKMFGKVKLLKIHHQASHTDVKFECKECKRTFNYKSALDRHHKRKHLKEKNHACQECERQFGTKFELDQHFEGYHGNLTKPSRTCNFCAKTFINERNLRIHMQAIHNKSKFECGICTKIFSFKSAKDRHFKVVHLHQKCHECNVCRKKFGTKYDLKNHFNRFHNENPVERRRYSCNQCNKDFVSSSALSRHRKGVHENIKQKSPKDYRCKICHEHLSNKYQKEKHMTQVHLNGKKLKRLCGYCQMEFELYEEFKAHIVSHVGLFICITCGNNFVDSELYSQHIESHKKIELKLRRFICDLCGHRLFNKIQLNVHMRKHVQDKNFYVCDICGQSYKFIAPFLYHKKLHSEKREFMCSYCNKGFIQKQDLLIHIRQHTNEKPFKCPVCGKRFTQKQVLNAHLQSHKTTRITYQCIDCDLKFFDKSKLKYHEESFHPEKRPYACFICNMTFKHEHNFRSHKNHKHKMNNDDLKTESDIINFSNFGVNS